MNDQAKRILLSVGFPLGALALISGPILLRWDDLPNPMNAKWGNDGTPTNLMSPGDFLGFQTTVAVLCALAFVLVGLGKAPRPYWVGIVGLVAGVVAPIFAVVSITTTWANAGAATAADSVEPSLWALAFSVVAPLLGFFAFGYVARDRLRPRRSPAATQATAGVTLSSSESAAWHSGAEGTWPHLFGLPVLIAGTGVTGYAFWSDTPQLIGIGAAMLIVAAAVLAFSTIWVSVDRRGLTVNYGRLPWPRNHIALSKIEGVEAIHVRPTEHGGWGYRGSRKALGKAAVVVRAGEGIRLDLKDGSEFVVTVDNAQVGAGVLNDLRIQRATGSAPATCR